MPSRAFRIANPIDAAAALVAALAGMAVLGNACFLRDDIGMEGWRPGGIAMCLVAAAYLFATALDRAGRSHLPTRAEPWLSLLILVLGWFVLARGPSSRLVLVGLGPTIAALAAASCVSLLVSIRERLVLARPAPDERRRQPVAAWRCALAALLLVGVVLLESRPLPTVKPWEAAAATNGRLDGERE